LIVALGASTKCIRSTAMESVSTPPLRAITACCCASVRPTPANDQEAAGQRAWPSLCLSALQSVHRWEWQSPHRLAHLSAQQSPHRLAHLSARQSPRRSAHPSARQSPRRSAWPWPPSVGVAVAASVGVAVAFIRRRWRIMTLAGAASADAAAIAPP